MFNDAEVDKAEWNKGKQRYGCIKLFNHSISFCYGKGFQTFILENKQIAESQRETKKIVACEKQQ